MGESVDSPLVYLALEQKLSQPMVREMLKAKEATKQWSTSEFRKKLHTMIEKEEEFRRVTSFNHVDPAPPRAPVKPFMREAQSSRPYSQNVAPVRTHPTNLACAAPNQDRFPPCPNALFSKPTMRKPENRERNSTAESRCAFCDQGHKSEECRQYETAEARSNRASELRLCFKCLARGHMMRECPRPMKCRICSRAHHAAVCKAGRETQRTQVSTAATVSSPTGRVLLMTAAATLENPRDHQKQAEVTVFFDTGSHRSFVTKEVAQKLGLESGEPEQLSLCTFGASKPAEVTSPRVYAQMQTRKGRLGLHLSVIDEIIPMPVTMAVANEGLGQFEYQGRSIEESLSDRQPDVLIGIDHIHQFQISSETRLDNGFMVSSSTLGTIVSGKENRSRAVSRRDVVLLSTESKHSVCKDGQLFDLVQYHFDLEKAGTEEDLLADDDAKVVEDFNQSLKVVEGRYEVSLPWKLSAPKLESNYWLARGRLRSTIRTLTRRPELLDMYHRTMVDQLEKGIIEKVPTNELTQENVVHYLPHQPVIREDKTHTKLRVVYDGSAKTGKSAASINQCLHRGPVLLCDLVGILLRFRIPKVCIVADIEKAFLQLSLSPKDRDACRFVWTEDPNAEDWEQRICTYRFTRVTFGLICSPFLLAATVKEHLQREQTPLADNIRENIYVDNIVIHSDSSVNTRDLCHKAKAMFGKVSMNLREFASNDRKSLEELPEEDRLPSSSVKLLGLLWDTENDNFIMSTKKPDGERITKRRILQSIAEVFDPLGWTTPAMLTAKMFFQELWKRKLGWDEEMPTDLHDKWMKIRASWNHKIIIPRRMFSESAEELELHVFSDASKDAFGAAAFIRSSPVPEIKARLILSKCRVKSLNSTATIPKLELQGLKLAAMVAKSVCNQMNIGKIRLWTDSQCVIGWLNSAEKQERFVENRVKVIRDYHVSYVQTDENPADLLTRGLTFEELADCEKWWKGPKWMYLSEKECIGPGPHFDPDEFASREEKPEMFHSACFPAAEVQERNVGVIPVHRVSSWKRAVRVSAYVLKFIRMVKTKSRSTSIILSVKELAAGRELLIREAQTRNPPTKGVQHTLELFREEKGIWKCKGRIGKSKLTVSAQTPIWLPRDDRTTELIVLDVHQRTFHAGSNTTLAKLREEFWLAQGRRKIRSIVSKLCMSCRRHTAAPYKLPKMPDLPEKRVTPSRPFQNTGLDYFGPINVKSKDNETIKVWVCIFTCFVSRAVHFEIAYDLSAEAFILTFKRFIARRGTPKSVMSDNGTNFKLASKIIVDAWKDVITSKSIQDEVAERGIEWKFIAERAPWRGGFWERLIGIVKNAMKKTIGRKILKADEFHTVITEIEMIINSRPLTYQSETEIQLPLRPIDLIIPHNLSSDAPSAEEQDEDDPTYFDRATPRDKLSEAFNTSVRQIDKFWQIWHSEYLLALRERQQSLEFSQGKTTNTFPKSGEVVLVQENDIPRNDWRLALVEELLPGADGYIRTAKIKYGHRTVNRAINVLYPLEVTNQEKEPNEEGPGLVRLSGRETQPHHIAIVSCCAQNSNSRDFRMTDKNDFVCLDVSDYELDYEEEPPDKTIRVEVGRDENEPPRKVRKEQQGNFDQEKEQSQVDVQVKIQSAEQRKQSETGRASAPPHKNKVASKEAPTTHRKSAEKRRVSKPASLQEFRVTVPIRQITVTRDFSIDQRVVKENETKVQDRQSGLWSIKNNDKAGWELTKNCYWHQYCTGLTVRQIAEEVDVRTPRNFGKNVTLPVPTIIQAAYVRWAMRQVYSSDSGDRSAMYIIKICLSPAENAVQTHAEMWQHIIASKALKRKSGVEKAWTFDTHDMRIVSELWRSTCQTAGRILREDPWKPVTYEDNFDWIQDEATRRELTRAAQQWARVLTNLRKNEYSSASSLIQARCVIFGDDLIRGATLHLKGTYYIEADIKETEEQINQRYFDSTVEHIVICTGLSVARKMHTIESYKKCLAGVEKIATKITHVKWWVIPPPDIEGDTERSGRVSDILAGLNKRLNVVKAFDQSNVWSRPFGMEKKVPTADDYELIFRRLYELGVDVLPLKQDDQGRATLEERLKSLLLHLRGVGSVAIPRKE